MNFPTFSGVVVLEQNRMAAHLPDRNVAVTMPRAVAKKLVELCDGHTAYDEVQAKLASLWRPKDVRLLLRSLCEAGVLIEADRIVEHAWTYLTNPRRYSRNVPLETSVGLRVAATRRAEAFVAPRYHRVAGSPLARLLERRRSSWTFADRGIPTRALFRVLWAGYGVLAGRKRLRNVVLARRAVPSGGGIYALRVYYVCLRPLPGVPCGVYEAHYRIDRTVGLRPAPGSIDAFVRASSDPGLLRFASGVIVVAGAFADPARKYDNRSVLLATLEAGHVAQNTLLAAGEADIGALETGGFIESRLRALLNLPDGTMPLTTIAIGAKPSRGDLAALGAWTNPRFHWIDFHQPWADPRVHVGAARVERKDGEPGWCWGRSRSAQEAYDKAVAEAQERLACGSPQRLYKAKLAGLPRAIDPRHLVSYGAAQYRARGFPFAPFEQARAYWWRDGVSCRTGRSVPLLADCVYFADALPAAARRRLYTRANTSGVAAFPTFEGAVERATFELLERDAFMRAWMVRATPPEIPARALPGLVQRRIQALAEGGIRVTVKNISTGIVPIVLIFSQHERRGATKVTAAAAYDPEQAIEHALTELEPRWYLQLEQSELPRINPRDVRSTSDHDTLYSQRRYFRRADALARPAVRQSLQEVRKGLCKSWPEVLAALGARADEVVCVDITPRGAGLDQGRAPLHVVRVLVPGLLPMSFGYNQEPWGTFASLNPAGGSRTTFSAGVFPHPFA